MAHFFLSAILGLMAVFFCLLGLSDLRSNSLRNKIAGILELLMSLIFFGFSLLFSLIVTGFFK